MPRELQPTFGELNAVRSLARRDVDRAVAAERERCAQAIRDCPSLDENGYVCQKSDALKAILKE